MTARDWGRHWKIRMPGRPPPKAPVLTPEHRRLRAARRGIEQRAEQRRLAEDIAPI